VAAPGPHSEPLIDKEPTMMAWFSVTPVGTASPSVTAEVARAVDAVHATGVAASTDAAGTLIEGTWEECTAGLRAACDAVLESAERVSVVAKLDVRTDRPDQTAADKLAALARARGG
jgi:uncharacterized protein (TIGR00106 family)